MTPDQIAIINERLKKAFTQEDFGDAAPMVEGDRWANSLPDPKPLLRQGALAGWVAMGTGQRIEPADPRWQGVKDGVMRGYFKKSAAQNTSDDELFKIVGEDMRAQDDAAMMGMEAAMLGQDFATANAAFAEKLKASPVAGRMDAYTKGMQAAYNDFSARIAPYRDLIKRNAANIKSALGSQADGFSFNQVIDEIVDIPEADQMLVLTAITKSMKALPTEDTSFAMDAFRSMARGAESLGAAAKSGGGTLMEMLTVPAPNDPTAREALRQAQEGDRRYYMLANVLRRMSTGEGYPIKSENYFANSVLQAAGMVPMTVSAFHPVGWAVMTSQLREDGATELLMSTPGMTFEQADSISLSTAPIRAGIEVISDRLLFGKLPAFERLMKSRILTPRSMLTRFGFRVGVGTAVETAEEVAQQFTLYAGQEIASALSQDVPGVEWGRVMSEIAQIPGEVAGPAAILAIVGGGGATLNDVVEGRAIVRDQNLLIASGASPSLAAEIKKAADAGDFKQAETLLARMVRPAEGDAATMAQRRSAARVYAAEQATRDQAVERDMRKSGLAVRKTAEGWAVETPEGIIAAPTFTRAQEIVRGEVQRQGMELDEDTLKAFDLFTARAQEGQDYELKPEEMSALERFDQAVLANDTKTIDELERRLNEERQAQNNPELGLDDLRVFGQSIVETKDNVKRYVSRILQGALANDLVEEHGESSLKRMVNNGRVTLPQVRTWIQAVEAATGDKYLKDETDQAVIEAYSSLLRVYATGTRKSDVAQTVKGQERRMRREMRARLAAQENSQDPKAAAVVRMARETMEFFKVVLAQARRFMSAKRAGKLGDLETLLNESLGLTEEAAHQDAVIQEAQQITGETFSLRTPPQGKTRAQMPDGAVLTEPTTFAIRAYHGTGAKIDRFTTAKIGTAAGSAYGWGLYFAERRSLAETYTTAFTESGNLYTVDLLPDAGDFLDYNKPLSQQSAKVRGIVESMLPRGVTMEDDPADLYDALTRQEGSEKAASLALAKAGIPGLRYLDGGSLPSSTEQFRNYVLFDEALVKILEENGKPVDQETYSMGGLSGRLNALAEALGRVPKGRPERRIEMMRRAQERFATAAREWRAVEIQAKAAISAAADTPTRFSAELAQLRADFDADMNAIRDEREVEVGGARVDKRGAEVIATIQAEFETRLTRRRMQYERERRSLENEQAKQEGQDTIARGRVSKQQMLAAMRTLDAVLAVLPPEVRGRVGGFIKLAELTTDEARAKEIESRFARIGTLLEKHFQEQLAEQVQKVFARFKPERDAGGKPKGKLGADVQEIVDAAQAAMKYNAQQLMQALAGYDALLASGDLTPEQEIQTERIRAMVELFGDWKDADAARMDAALQALMETASEGWAKRKLAEIMKREGREDMRKALRADTGKTGVASERTAMQAQAAKTIGKGIAKLLNLSSLAEVMNFLFGAKSATAAELLNREREASGQYEDAVQAMADTIEQFFTRLAGGTVRGEKLRFKLAQPNLKVGGVTLSELQGIQALLMWQQPDGQRHMQGPRDENNNPIPGKWAYTQEWIDELTDALSPEALEVKRFLEGLYAQEYEPLNALYRERHGINLPHHKNYAQLTVRPQQINAGQIVDPVSGAAISGTTMTPGSLRTRSRTAIAQPEFRDALAVFIAHNKQMEYWKAYYDVSTDFQALLNNRDVQDSIIAKAGDQAAYVATKWAEAIAMQGMRDAGAGLSVWGFVSRMQGRAATVALIGRASTLWVQSTQLAAASVKMPTGAYLVRFGKLMAGQMNWGDAIRSPFIQRRYKSAPPLIRQAMESLANATKPNQIKHAASQLGKLLSGADALFTAGTYAMLLDYHRTEGARQGLQGQELEDFARQQAETDTEAVAQPTRMATRSLVEITNTNPLAKTNYAFVSESRQKIALFAWAAYNAKKNPAYAAKVAFLTFVVGGLGTQVLKNLWREAKGDDDERKWNTRRLLIAMAAAPFKGIPLVSDLTGDPGMFSNVEWSGPAFKRMWENDYDQQTDMMRDADTLLSVLGYLNDTAAGVAVLSHAGLEFAKVLENLITDKENP